MTGSSSIGSTESHANALSYATPTGRVSVRVWAAVAVLMGGLALMVIAGCFLIGVLALLQPGLFFGAINATGNGVASLSTTQQLFMVVLYAFAFLSASGGVILLVMGTRGLLSVLRTQE